MRGTERGARLEGDRRILQVDDVLRAIEDQFRIAFPRRIWVFGTVRRLRNGEDLQFVLTEASAEAAGAETRTLPSVLEDSAFNDIDASLRRLHDVAVQDLLVEGHLVRAGGLLTYDTTEHTVVFSVTALDPQPTADWLSDRRQTVREAAEQARLAERQRDVQVPLAPRSVGLVGAQDDPTLAAARAVLTGAGYDVEVVDYAVREVGARMADGLANALRQAGHGGHDAVLLVREYGRPLALAPYDTEPVVRAVAMSPVPVLTGLGSADSPAAAEAVAHQAFETAAEAADAVVRKLRRAEGLVDATVEQISTAGDEALRRAAMRVEQTRAAVAEDARVARTRAEAARAKRVLWTRVGAALLAAVIIVVALLTSPWVLAALVLPLALVLFSEQLRPKRRRGPMPVSGLSFVDALQRMGQIRHDLESVADPDEVTQLEQEAAGLADHCRTLLRRPRPLRARPPEALDTDAAATVLSSTASSSGEAYDQEATEATTVGTPAPDADVHSATVQEGNTGTAPITLPDAGGSQGGVRRVTGAAADDAPTQALVTNPVAHATTDADTDPRQQPLGFATQRTVVLPGDPPPHQADEQPKPDVLGEDAPTTALPRQ